MDFWKITEEGHFIDKQTFGRINYQMTLPQVVLFDERVEFEFQYRAKSGFEKQKSLLVAIAISNRFGERQSYDEICKVLHSIKPVRVSMPVIKPVNMSKTGVEFVYLHEDGEKSIISYFFEKQSAPAFFTKVERCQMSEEEKCYFADSLRQINNKTNNEEGLSTYIGHVSGFDRTTNVNLLQEYIDALHYETIFLKQNGGKKYKVSNGRRLASGKEGYSYQFEMESELFLPEDAPVSIITNAAIHADGSVLSCEEFQIIIIVNKDLGDRVYKAEIGVEPWKLLVAQKERISKINANQHPLAVKLISEGPRLSTKQSIDNIPKGQNIVKERIKTEPITIVWGPPGTGKTYTMSDIAIDYLIRNKTVLIVSHSNVSVDGVIKKIADKLRKQNLDPYLVDGKVFRYGYVRDAELSRDDYASSFNYALNHSHELKKQMDLLVSQKDELKENELLTDKRLVEIEKQLNTLRGRIREQEKVYVAQAQLIGTTISKVTIDGLFEFEKFDLVMFDEVSMAYVTQLACAASFARERFLCVGDFMQLPPIAQNQMAKAALEKDIFEYLGITDGTENLYYHPWLVMLDMQYRMYPDIAEFVNARVYKHLLRNGANTKADNQPVVDDEPLSGHALNLIDLHGTYAAASKNADNSRYNILSAIISFGSALSSETENVNTIGIITPYAAQMRLIRAMIKDYRAKKPTIVTCSTVHQFQGSESDVIVFDAVESYPTSKAGFLMSKNLHSVKRLVNVAITRTKGKLINVANSKFWLKEFENRKSHIYYQFINYLVDKQNVVSNSNKNLRDYLYNLNTGNNIKIYLKQDDCFEKIKKDFDAAEDQIVISIPDGELAGNHKAIFELIKSAKNRGVQILMKSNTYAKLPEEWKKLCIGTENAYFPLIMIDGKTIWYGIPCSKGKFEVGNWSFVTVCDTIIRIKGENTIEMISSLSELMMKRIENTVTPLLPKREVENVNEKNVDIEKSDGLAHWVSNKLFCPSCKNHFVLAKGRTGKFYVRCSNRNCKETNYLSKEFVNNYINMNNVSCPQDGGELTAKIGQYGLYITCSHGHTIKVDQI